MKKLAIVLILVAVWLWQNDRLPFIAPTGAYNKNGDPELWVFTSDDCGQACKDCFRELKKRGAPFTELVVDRYDRDSENFKRWMDLGRGVFPFIVAGQSKVFGYQKAQLAGLLGELYGERYLTWREMKYFKKHFNSDGSPRIVMYGTDWCGYCKKLRAEFVADDIDFLDIDVEKSRNSQEMSKTLGIRGYPTIYVGYTRVHSLKVKEIASYL